MKSVLVCLLLSLSACPQPNKPVTAAIDCLKQDQGQIGSLLSEFLPIVEGGKADWSSIYTRARDAGINVGGCFLGELVNTYLSSGKRVAGDYDSGWTPRATFELFRSKELNGATLKTKQGDL